MRRAGFVLVGGKSRRMGRDKALIPLDGVAMAELVARRVERVCGAVTLIGNAARYRHLGFDVLQDLHPGLGPLSGLETALESGLGDWNLLVACDLPWMSEEYLASLFEAAGDLDEAPLHQAVAPRRNGEWEPLCAVYHTSALAAVRRAICEGRLRMTSLIAGLHPMAAPAPEERILFNVNTPEQFSALRSGLE